MPSLTALVKLLEVDLYSEFSVKLSVKLVLFPVFSIRQSCIVRPLCFASFFCQLTKLPQRFFCNSLAEKNKGQNRDRLKEIRHLVLHVHVDLLHDNSKPLRALFSPVKPYEINLNFSS